MSPSVIEISKHAAYAARSLATWTGCHSLFPRGVLMPLAAKARAIPVNVVTPLDWISAITARVPALAFLA